MLFGIFFQVSNNILLALNNYKEAMRILLEGGATLDIRTNDGLKARDLASGKVKFLLQNRLNCYDFDIIKPILPLY
jgi:tRNA uridine 5-carbamoylmethylation protein Kti12